MLETLISRNDMLTKVRQHREQMAKLQNQLIKIADSSNAIFEVGNTDTPDSTRHHGLSKEEKLRQQVMRGTESLERASESLAR